MRTTQLEREEEALAFALDEGQMSQSEYNAAMRELQRDYRAMAQEAAEEARERELERW